MNNKKLLLLILAVLIVGTVLYFIRFQSSHQEVSTSYVKEEYLHSSEKEADIPVKAPSAPEESGLDLKSELANSMKELPTLDDLKNLSFEEVHHTPEMISEGGALIGELIDQAEKDPTRREETVKFLKGCAEEESVVPQLRALCWNKTLNQISEWKVFVPVTDANVPEDIKALGSQL